MNNNIRQTFGIIDQETGKQYEDIIHAFLLSLRITEEDRKIGWITLTNMTSFRLHCDSVVRKEIIEKGYCNCIVSFQIRKDIKIALARKDRNL